MAPNHGIATQGETWAQTGRVTSLRSHSRVVMGLRVVSAGSPGQPALSSGSVGPGPGGGGTGMQLVSSDSPTACVFLRVVSTFLFLSRLLPFARTPGFGLQIPLREWRNLGQLVEKPGEDLGLTHSPWNPGVIV